MTKFEFQMVCPDKSFCKNLQSLMSDFKNTDVRDKNTYYDHKAIKSFDTWEDARDYYNYLKKEHPEIIDLKMLVM